MNKIVALLISMLKAMKLPNMLKPEIENSNDKIVKFGVGNSIKLAKKPGKSKS